MAKVLASEKYNVNRKHSGGDLLHFVSSADLAMEKRQPIINKKDYLCNDRRGLRFNSGLIGETNRSPN